jgi:hypothetical protein
MKRTLALTVLVMLLASLALPSVVMFADGTETLGSPSIPIAEGSGFVAAGTGLYDMQPGTIDIDVPGTVVQVLLYWSVEFSGAGPGDHTITVSGNSVTGTSIGGPTLFYGDVSLQSFRADITGLGLVFAGSNTLAVSDLADGLGAGVLVIFDDGSGATGIQIRDGSDLAFINFGPPLDTTVPQTFNFAPAPTDRFADLVIFAASVGGPNRPNAVVITVGGTTTTVINPLGSYDGNLWDTAYLQATIPAGAESLTVQVLSYDDGSGNLPASLNWIGAGLYVAPPPPPGGEGCTPGGWAGGNGAFRWDEWPDGDWNPPDGNPFYHDTQFNEFFAPWGSLDGLTMYDLVSRGGGKDDARKAARSLVAAYLNATHDSVDYPLTTTELINAWNDAVAGNAAFIDLHTNLDTLNNLGCELP